MPRFHYTAVDAQGQSLAGDIDGSSLAVVRDALRQQGLQVLEVLPAPVEIPLSVTEAAAITQQISSATQGDMPLVVSLRGFSEEIFSRRLRRRLARVCDALESGEALQTVLANPDLRLPPSVGAILASGLPLPAMNHLLSLSVRTATTTADLRARTFLLMTYPALMVGAMTTFWVFLFTYVTPQFSSIFADFGTELPSLTLQIIQLSDVMMKIDWVYFLFLPPVLVLIIFGYRFGLPAPTRQRIWCNLPILGSMYRLTALSEFARLLASMLESRVPLPTALTWSASGSSDADLRERVLAVVARLQLGEDALTAAERVPGLPPYLEQMLRFAAHGAEASTALRYMADLMETRARTLSQAAMPLIEPVMLIAMMISIGVYVVAVFMPLIKLLNDLS